MNESHPGLQMRTKCKTNSNYDDKFFNTQSLSQIARLQYGIEANRGMISLGNLVDAFAGLDEAISDGGSTSGGNESIEEDNDDDDNGDDGDGNKEKNTSEQCDKSLHQKTESKEDTKRKSSEAGCSDQNKTLAENPENTKRMKMNTPSTVNNFLNSQSTTSSNELWETMSSDSSEPDDDFNLDDSDNWVSSEDNDHNGLRHDDLGGVVYNSLFNDGVHDSDTDSEVSRDFVLYRFLSERKENELSKLMKGKIDLLPIPAMLKQFLNYNKED